MSGPINDRENVARPVAELMVPRTDHGVVMAELRGIIGTQVVRIADQTGPGVQAAPGTG